ncbi:hypothetical protein HID58_014427, partial [Brassica napus]
VRLLRFWEVDMLLIDSKGHRITFSGKILNYQTTVAQLVELLGDENAASDLRCCFTPPEDGTFTHNKLLILSMGTTTSSIFLKKIFKWHKVIYSLAYQFTSSHPILEVRELEKQPRQVTKEKHESVRGQVLRRVLFQLAGSHYDQKIEHMYEIAVFLATGKEVSKGQTKSWRKKELLPLNLTSNTLSSPGDEFWLRKSDESSQSSQDDAETS